MVRWITIVLSVIGLSVGVWAVSTAPEKPVDVPLARAASVNPYARGVAALGLVEPSGRDVGVVAPEPGLVVEVYAQVGDRVAPGAPLFRLDSRVLEADLLRAEAAVVAAQSEIDRWHALPRAEDLPPLEAAVARAEALAKDREDVLARTREAVAKGSGNERDVMGAQYAAEAARADASKARADLAKAKAGGWAPDLAVARAVLAQKRAEVEALKVLKDRLTVRAPREGTVLRRSIEAGEYAGGGRADAPMILGDLSRLAVRAQVDEEDVALIGPSPRAVARTRGAVVQNLELRLVRVEPYARPKTNLAGTNVERVDTRVIEVVFEVVTPPATAVYPGQAVDVFVDAASGGQG